MIIRILLAKTALWSASVVSYSADTRDERIFLLDGCVKIRLDSIYSYLTVHDDLEKITSNLDEMMPTS